MPTLLLRLAGPMQSWGTTSRFDQRDTGKEPSKSGVIGLLAAALGIDRENWIDLEPLTHLAMGVRHDRLGVLKRDYQTAGCAATDKMRRADGSLSEDGVTSQRHYLADAVFLVALEGRDRSLLEHAHAALNNPVWPLALGRKSYVPAESIWLDGGVVDMSLLDALAAWPWLATPRKWEAIPERLLVSIESSDGAGALRMDQPLSSFAERRFGARFVHSDWIKLTLETNNAAA
ncbi:MAG: type I-E CRISPR-associated protein Cas5/CasD [Gammaproteobacteria bacterium 28-57-27]|nr:MAG: type I-E CRISPR-associated protein Cas5/CasD [Gammaproteobacteria bacterium 28-57-27]